VSQGSGIRPCKDLISFVRAAGNTAVSATSYSPRNALTRFFAMTARLKSAKRAGANAFPYGANK